MAINMLPLLEVGATVVVKRNMSHSTWLTHVADANDGPGRWAPKPGIEVVVGEGTVTKTMHRGDARRILVDDTTWFHARTGLATDGGVYTIEVPQQTPAKAVVAAAVAHATRV